MAPHLRPGEVAIVDTADTRPQPGELFALTFMSAAGERIRIVQVVPGAGVGVAFRYGVGQGDGPLSIVGWGSKCRGRVVGVMTLV